MTPHDRALAPRPRPLVVTPARARVARDLAGLRAAGQPREDYLASVDTAVRYRLITDDQARALRRLA